MLSAGDLTTRAILQSRSTTPDGQGGTTAAYSNVATLWAGVRAVQGVEGYAGDKQNPMVTYLITIRYRAGVVGTPYGVDASMRLVVGARVFDIRSVIDTDEAHEELVLGCELYTP